MAVEAECFKNKYINSVQVEVGAQVNIPLCHLFLLNHTLKPFSQLLLAKGQLL